MTSPDDLEILEEDAPPPPAGTPMGFRELLALALKTTDPAVLAQAERDYRGIYPSAHDCLVAELTGHLPPELDWLPSACAPSELRRRYETRLGLSLWELRHSDGRVRVGPLQAEVVKQVAAWCGGAFAAAASCGSSAPGRYRRSSRSAFSASAGGSRTQFCYVRPIAGVELRIEVAEILKSLDKWALSEKVPCAP